MENEMIERVARALEPGAFETLGRGYTQRNAFDTTAFLNAEKTVRRARRKARVAIEAMREPTDAMTDAAGRATGYEETAVMCYRAMIDGALGRGDPPEPALSVGPFYDEPPPGFGA